ncbi:DUF4279 domain-containing protein [Tepidibacter aestuarii]|uniref:DUF4279 domain-containing protein n=1 Tax=Tepidibacter aestuarii TaxID=2925782 RepID=UPI0020BF8950|nr:DUF4279 domain-containing protein [Tepidibacter aestuarii]CAH2213577.1 DUF4279 domain-containing protein [Tepidibacter aestuarii]
MDKTNIKVDFRIVGDNFEPSDITSKLSLTPTSAWKKGDKFTRREKNLEKKYSCWRISTGYEESVDIVLQLNKIINILNDKKAILQDLKKVYSFDYRIDAVINIENGEAPALYIESEIIKFANDIGAELDFDLYILS